MNFTHFETALSPHRLTRYLNATSGNRAKALYLYRLNLRLGQEFQGLLSVFEVTLRNAIDRHYASEFSDPDWLFNQCAPAGMFSDPILARNGFQSRSIVLEAHSKLGNRYDSRALLSSLSLGTWCYLFAPLEFRAGGQTLHRIFPARPRGTHASLIFTELGKLRFFRNRIAHHEPIVFDSAGINLALAKRVHQNLCEKITWLDYRPDKLFRGLDHTQKWFDLIDSI